MTVTINVNGLSLCHKDSGGVSMATLPDVCKTPTPGGPVPVAYPNVALSSDLARGTRTIAADGGNMCANFGSEFSRSSGDEAGTLGGISSGTFIKEASWLTHSFDVMLEGKGACRLTDKMFHNHQNSVNAGGLVQRMLQAQGLLKEMLCACDKDTKPKKDDTCMSLGARKHACMEKKKADHNRSKKGPKLDGERGYNFKTGKPDLHPMGREARFKRIRELRTKIKQTKERLERFRLIRKASKIAKRTPWSFLGGLVVDAVLIDPAIDRAINALAGLEGQASDLGRSLKDKIFPDGALRGPDGKIEGFFEYKFRCPEGVKSGRGISKGIGNPSWSPGQKEKVEDMIAAMKANDPGSIDAEATTTLLTTALC